MDKKTFNESAGPRLHHYILRLSLHAGVDHTENPQDADKPPFQQASLFLQRLMKWVGKKGLAASFKGEILPLAEDGRPRLRIACPPALMSDICDSFPGKVAQISEIPLPLPVKQKKSIWKKIFGG